MNFAIPTDHRTKGEKLDKYQDFAGEWKQLSKMKVMLIPVVVRVLATVPNRLQEDMGEEKIRVRIEINPKQH